MLVSYGRIWGEREFGWGVDGDNIKLDIKYSAYES